MTRSSSFLPLTCVVIISTLLQSRGCGGTPWDCSPQKEEPGNKNLSSPPVVDVVINSTSYAGDNNGTTTPLLIANCSAPYPIQWTFTHHPHTLQKGEEAPTISNISGWSWNVSYTRLKEDILDETGVESWTALLTFANLSHSQISLMSPKCVAVADHCLATSLTPSDLDKTEAPGQGQSQGPANCSVDLWFDESSGNFLCKNKDGSNITTAPSLSYRYCSNPTECGVGFVDSDCWEHGGHTHPQGGCRDCSRLRVGSEFPIPKVISCTGQGKNKGSGVKLLGYFHSLRELGGRPATSYVSWEEADPADLVSLMPSKSRLNANETFEVECSASSYYFSGGMHLTLKTLSGSDSSYSEAELGTQRLNGTRESLQRWSPGSGRAEGSPRGMPLRRTILARGLVLNPGEYEVTCYAPVWNSTQWTAKTVLISVSSITAPTFITGNGTTTLTFAPRHNISCLARGVPPPKISWTYRPDRIQDQVVEVVGSSKQMSWSILTLPASVDASGSELEFKCRAENGAGWTEKLFLVTRSDESFLVSTKIAATVVLLGFVGNLIVFFFCWKKLFAESEEEEDEERKGLAGIKFLRALWHARYLSWCKCRCLKGSGGDRSTSGGGPGSDKVCNHPKCRQKMTQTAEL